MTFFVRRGRDYPVDFVNQLGSCKKSYPFTWGKNAADAVHNAVVLEEVAKMACQTEMINAQVSPAPQVLQDKHYFRKHGKDAYYGQ